MPLLRCGFFLFVAAVGLLAADSGPFPLRVGPTGRYLVDHAANRFWSTAILRGR